MKILDKIRAAGFAVDMNPDGSGLRITPSEKLTADRRAMLKQHKAEIMNSIMAEAAAALAYWRAQGLVFELENNAVTVSYAGMWADFTQAQIDAVDQVMTSNAARLWLQAEEKEDAWPEYVPPSAATLEAIRKLEDEERKKRGGGLRQARHFLIGAIDEIARRWEIQGA